MGHLYIFKNGSKHGMFIFSIMLLFCRLEEIFANLSEFSAYLTLLNTLFPFILKTQDYKATFARYSS